MSAALLASLLLAQAAPAPPQDAPVEEYVVTDTWSDESCTPETAVSWRFEAPGRATNCVTIEGLWVDNRLFVGLDAYYRSSSLYAGPRTDRLGVYGWRDRLEPPTGPTPARLTGRLGDCEDLTSRPGVVMVFGYCHYTTGPYVALGQAETTGPVPERLTGEMDRTRLGHLTDLPLDSTQGAYAEAQARRWLELVKSGDPAAYATALELTQPDRDLEYPESEVHAVFRETGSVFERLRAERDPALKIWTIPPPPPEPDEPAADPSDIAALACFRLGAWTEDRWPVSSIDADNHPSRPYACVEIDRWTQDGRSITYHHVAVREEGLTEPSAFEE